MVANPEKVYVNAVLYSSLSSHYRLVYIVYDSSSCHILKNRTYFENIAACAQSSTMYE